MAVVPEDILADWRGRKFVVCDEPDMFPGQIIVILANFSYWTDHYDELGDWCRNHDVTLAGMTVTLRTQEQMTLFALRWS
jgi:hypothetical protein